MALAEVEVGGTDGLGGTDGPYAPPGEYSSSLQKRVMDVSSEKEQ